MLAIALYNNIMPINANAFNDVKSKVDNFPQNVYDDDWWNKYSSLIHDDGGVPETFIRYNVNDFQNCSDKIFKISYSVLTDNKIKKPIPNAPEGKYIWKTETIEGFIGMTLEDPTIFICLYASDYQTYYIEYNINEKCVFSIKEIIAKSNISDYHNISVVSILHNSRQFFIDNIDFKDCVQGWNEIDGDNYYVKKDGTLATKPCVIKGVFYKFDKSGICQGRYTGWAKSAGNKVYYKDGLKVTKNTTINGVRWKFDKNGICQGKYSGFVRSSKGRRYYNNGVMLRNQKFTLNGKKYVADSKGWVTEI